MVPNKDQERIWTRSPGTKTNSYNDTNETLLLNSWGMAGVPKEKENLVGLKLASLPDPAQQAGL